MASVQRWWRCRSCGEPVIGSTLVAGQSAAKRPTCAGCSGAVRPTTWVEWQLGGPGTTGTGRSNVELPGLTDDVMQRVIGEWLDERDPS